MAKNKNKNTKIQSVIFCVVAIIVSGAVTFGVFMLARHLNTHDSNNKSPNTTEQNSPDIIRTEEDAKDEEKAAASSMDAKDRAEAAENAKTEVEKNSAGLKVAKPELSFVAAEGDKIAVGGFIPNINETEGTCTFVFTKDSETVTESTGILPNPSYISCETARIEKSRFTSGTWNVKIKYKSNLSEGESEAQTYTIQ